MVSGSTLLTALSLSKGYRTLIGKAPGTFYKTVNIGSVERSLWNGGK
jgi:hypothetical protein